MCVHVDGGACTICSGALVEGMAVIVVDGYQYPIGYIEGYSLDNYTIRVSRPGLPDKKIVASPKEIVMVVSR